AELLFAGSALEGNNPMSRLASFRSLCVFALLAASPCSAQRIFAVEPAREFLDALRDRGYYDVAIDYLNSVADNPAVPVTFKETMLYERGLTLVQGAKFQRDIAIREKW